MMNNKFNMNEDWIKLENDEIPKGNRYAVSKFIQDDTGTRIFLDNASFAAEIIFDGIPLLVRNSSEDCVRMRTWSYAQEKYDNTFFREDFFFEIKNSSLIDWLIEESYGFYEKEKIKHYCIVANDGFIDILSAFAPKIIISKI